MSVRRLIVEVDLAGLNVTEFCLSMVLQPGSSIS